MFSIMGLFVTAYLQWSVATVPVTEFNEGSSTFVKQFFMDKSLIFIGFCFVLCF